MHMAKRIALYNTLTRKKEIFKPLRKNWVGLYTCGPTVYNFVHIGNLRTYIFEDVLRRTLEYAGYKVKHVMNITDVEDKIIRDSKKTGKTLVQFTRPFEQAFLEDIKKLNTERAWKYPRATEHINEMVAVIRQLLKKGLAYKADNSVYFDISKFKKYGKLSRLAHRELKVGARVDADEYTKHDVQDFVLWKSAKPGEPSWKTPFGKGRPGWHIECSAMSMKYLGPTFDIHAGGVDLIFPHHENEIAQSEGTTGKPFVRVFVEGEHLLVNGEKMAKSLGNFLTFRDIEKRGVNPLSYRYLVLTSHYRSKLNFAWESLRAAERALERLYGFVRELKNEKQEVRSKKQGLTKYKKSFDAAMTNDLNTPEALAVIWNLVRDYRKNPVKFSAKEVLTLLYDFDKVLGLNLKNIKIEKIPAKVSELIRTRELLRKKKRWQEADKVKAQIEDLGYEIKDAPEGASLLYQKS